MDKKEIKVGDRFGKLVVLDTNFRVPNPNYPKVRGKTLKKIKCKCDCGNETLTFSSDLKLGRRTSCGCNKMSENPIKSGDRFGDLIVLSQEEDHVTDKGKRTHMYKCKCLRCGSIKTYREGNLKSGSTITCGCGKRKYDEYKPGDKVGLILLKEKMKSYKHPETGSTGEWWIADCDCGNKNVIVNAQNIRKAQVASCGCRSSLGLGKLKREDPVLRYFTLRAKSILDRTRTPFDTMFSNYGGRGIKCELGEWPTQVAAKLKMVPNYFDGAELDRIDSNGNYTLYHPDHGYDVWEYDDPVLKKKYQCRGNLRWLTPAENSTRAQSDYELKDKSEMANRLLTEYGFTKRCRINNFNEDDFKEIKTPFANERKNRRAYKPVSLWVPTTMSKEDIEKLYKKYKKLYTSYIPNRKKYKEENKKASVSVSTGEIR